MAAVSEFNQRAYELFARPLLRAMSNETRASWADFHPLRASRWSWSDFNPWLWWLRPPPMRPSGARARRRRQPCRGREGAARNRRAPRSTCTASSATPSARRAFSRSTATCSLRCRPSPGRNGRRRGRPRELPFVKRRSPRWTQGGYREAASELLARPPARAAAARAARSPSCAEHPRAHHCRGPSPTMCAGSLPSKPIVVLARDGRDAAGAARRARGIASASLGWWTRCGAEPPTRARTDSSCEHPQGRRDGQAAGRGRCGGAVTEPPAGHQANAGVERAGLKMPCRTSAT